jgi:hypothetical protein
MQGETSTFAPKKYAFGGQHSGEPRNRWAQIAAIWVHHHQWLGLEHVRGVLSCSIVMLPTSHRSSLCASEVHLGEKS